MDYLFTDFFNLIDYISVLLFIISWHTYSRYARKKSKTQPTLAQTMHKVRKFWIYQIISTERHHRIPDTQIMNILHRGISFFVSTTVLIIAGLLAFIVSGEQVILIIELLPFVSENSLDNWQIKVAFITVIFVICFFRLTWALRQHQYADISILGIKELPDSDTSKKKERLVKELSGLYSDSGNNFNHALRGYYFGLSMLTWLISPYYFIITNLLVVWVIYRREFSSKTLSFLQNIIKINEEIIEKSKKEVKK